MFTEKKFDTGEASLNYAEGPPNGAPLIMLHGGTDRWQTFQPVIQSLTESWHVYALDFRGHGKSSRASTGYCIPDYARDIVAFVRSRIGEPAVFMGHSMGADTSLYIAAEAPDVLRAAVLEEPLYSHNGARIFEFAVYSSLLVFQKAMEASTIADGIAAEIARARPKWPEALVREKAEHLSLLDPDVLAQIVNGRHTDGYDTEDLLPKIRQPVLIIQGNPDRGGLLNDDEAKRMASLLACCTFVQMPDGGHELHSRRPEKFLEIASKFFDTL